MRLISLRPSPSPNPIPNPNEMIKISLLGVRRVRLNRDRVRVRARARGGCETDTRDWPESPATSLYALACPTREVPLLQAARAILRPLVRQLIAHGVTYPAFGRLGEGGLHRRRHQSLHPGVQEADRQSRGVGHRHHAQGDRPDPPRSARGDRGGTVELDNTLAARVVGRWLAGPPYAGADGTPHTLPYEGPRRPRASPSSSARSAVTSRHAPCSTSSCGSARRS